MLRSMHLQTTAWMCLKCNTCQSFQQPILWLALVSPQSVDTYGAYRSQIVAVTQIAAVLIQVTIGRS